MNSALEGWLASNSDNRATLLQWDQIDLVTTMQSAKPEGPTLHETKRICISHQRDVLLVGGTGFLGRQMAQRLVGMGHRVTVSTRDPDRVKVFADSISVIAQNVVDERLASFDAVVVLSVINNDVLADAREVYSVNVAYPVSLARKMAETPGKALIAFGSVHAEDPRRGDPYSSSKRQLRKALEEVEGGAIRFFVIPPVYGTQFVRKLKMVDRLPEPLKRAAISMIGAVKPLVHVDRIVAEVEQEITASPIAGFQVRHIADDQSSNLIYRAVIRATDFLLALLVLVGFAWLMILIAVLIRLESPGPALFRQRRVGWHGEEFICYKFRTMRVGAPQVATHEISRDLTTRVGRSLRRWKLDELPQVFNVLMNQMSWVGPRPGLPVQTELKEERRKRGVLTLKPGITGLAQVRGVDMSDPAYLARCDAEFLFLRSLPLYFRLLVQTFMGRGRGDRVR